MKREHTCPHRVSAPCLLGQENKIALQARRPERTGEDAVYPGILSDPYQGCPTAGDMPAEKPNSHLFYMKIH